jgi:single-strand DNA-binding protein
MAKLRFAVNRRWRDQAGEWQEETGYFGGTLWRDHAENAAESLHKGTRVIVVGRLEQRSWETQEGEKRSVVEVSIEEIGPSLRWATASVNRTAKAGGGDFASSSSSPSSSSGSMPPGPVARDDYGPDEAPF